MGHAAETVAWTEGKTQRLQRMVNTHWHSDHVGANALLQSRGVGVAASKQDSQALAHRDPGCSLADYLDQPVPQYAVDDVLSDGQTIAMGEADWEAIATPGHSPGHLALWQPDERILVAGDALSDYDVGWVSLATDGPDAAAQACASLARLNDLNPRVILPAHGPVPADTATALANAHRRAQRLVADHDGAVWHGARRIFAFALMIRGGIAVADVESYLHRQPWLIDAVRLLRRPPADIAAELVATMERCGAAVVDDNRLMAAAEQVAVRPETLQIPFPREWPAAG